MIWSSVLGLPQSPSVMVYSVRCFQNLSFLGRKDTTDVDEEMQQFSRAEVDQSSCFSRYKLKGLQGVQELVALKMH